MENYEQKYKEAIERCKSWIRGEHPECFTEAQKAGEFIFPELRESEDERIRKEIIQFLQLPHPQFVGKRNYEEWIAWLEKQDEQKSTDSYCQKNCKGFKETGKCFADGDCKAKRDAEQNHIWSEEDDNFIKELCNLLASISINGYIGKYYVPDLVNKLQSFKTKTDTRQESSDEDVWSEEDEEKLNSTIFLLKEFREAYQENAESCINWLKSLKPCWKPTEEQLSAMDWEIRNTSEGSWQRREMESLYNFLKTL